MVSWSVDRCDVTCGRIYVPWGFFGCCYSYLNRDRLRCKINSVGWVFCPRLDCLDLEVADNTEALNSDCDWRRVCSFFRARTMVSDFKLSWFISDDTQCSQSCGMELRRAAAWTLSSVNEFLGEMRELSCLWNLAMVLMCCPRPSWLEGAYKANRHARPLFDLDGLGLEQTTCHGHVDNVRVHTKGWRRWWLEQWVHRRFCCCSARR